MELIECIKKRRSVRKFINKEVSHNDIETMLDCAMSAPSARNQQAWRFVVIDDREILDKIADHMIHAKMCKTANKAIIVCSVVEDEMQELYWVPDSSAATQNILLCATALGIGSVWVAIHPRKEKVNFIKELLQLPQNIEPLSLIPLGYPDEEKKPSNRYDENKVYFNRYS